MKTRHVKLSIDFDCKNDWSETALERLEANFISHVRNLCKMTGSGAETEMLVDGEYRRRAYGATGFTGPEDNPEVDWICY